MRENDPVRRPSSSQPHVLVLGASGELGGACARLYAHPGSTLSLWGRDHRRLEAIAAACKAAGASVRVRSLDIADTMAAVDALIEEDMALPVDLAIIASGTGEICPAGDLVEPAGLIARLVTVNFTAPAALAGALADRMATRGSGQIVLVGSAAAFHALPFASAYAGSKAGLARFAEALRIAMRPHGVTVTLVSPGFIDTAAGRAVQGPKPFILQPEEVARRIAGAVTRGRGHAIMPWPFALLRLLDRLLPAALRDRLLRALRPRG